MHVRDDGASRVCNRPANHTGGGLREDDRRHAQVQESRENQVASQLRASFRPPNKA